MNMQAIGENAGKLWRYLGENGPTPVRNLGKGSGVDATLSQLAVGWLAREGKIQLEKKSAQLVVSLTPDELRVFERERMSQHAGR